MSTKEKKKRKLIEKKKEGKTLHAVSELPGEQELRGTRSPTWHPFLLGTNLHEHLTESLLGGIRYGARH